VVLEVLIDVEGIEVLRVEARQEHVHHDGDVDLLGVGQIAVGELLVLDTLLHILVVEIEFPQAMVRAIAFIVGRKDGL
jgi:hypothetical protein